MSGVYKQGKEEKSIPDKRNSWRKGPSERNYSQVSTARVKNTAKDSDGC